MWNRNKKLTVPSVSDLPKTITVKSALEEVLKDALVIKNVIIIYELNDGRQQLRSNTMTYGEKNMLARFLEAFCLQWFKFE